MDKRILNISFNLAGSGSVTKRLTIPSTVIADMGITKEEREVEFIYNDIKKEIRIRKFKKN